MIENLQLASQGVAFRGVHVVGLGARTSNGLTPQSVVASTRAGTRRHTLLRHQRDAATGEAVRASAVAGLPLTMPLVERLRHLAVAAARQALHPWHAISASLLPDQRSMGLLLATCQERPGFTSQAQDELLTDVASGLGVTPNPARMGVLPGGHEAGLAALLEAAAWIDAGEIDAVLVGGVDCSIDPEGIDLLSAMRRLRSAAAPDGVLPGEAAGFVLLCGPRVLSRGKLTSLADVASGARAHEPRPWYVPDPGHGEGLTAALWGALHPAGKGPPRAAAVTYADLTGEHWRAEEWMYAYTRTGKLHGHPLRVEHPGDRWGDVGAAFGPLLVAHAALDLHDRDNPHDSALVWASSDRSPLRAACLLTRPTT